MGRLVAENEETDVGEPTSAAAQPLCIDRPGALASGEPAAVAGWEPEGPASRTRLCA